MKLFIGMSMTSTLAVAEGEMAVGCEYGYTVLRGGQILLSAPL